jgi:hypothetical protein
MALPGEKETSDPWEIYAMPGDTPVPDIPVPERDPEHWDGEDPSWFRLKADSIHRFRSYNQRSNLALMDDLRGYPRSSPSQNPTDADVEAAYERAKSIPVPLKEPVPWPPGQHPTSPHLAYEQFLKREEIEGAPRIVVRDAMDDLLRDADLTPRPRARTRPDGLSIGHILDKRHRKGRIRVPEDKKAISKVPEAYRKGLKELGERLHCLLQEGSVKDQAESLFYLGERS